MISQDYQQKPRRFTLAINRLSAAQVRQTAAAALRRKSLLLEFPSRGLVEPPDYESLLQSKMPQIEKDPCKDIIVFPEDELRTVKEPRKYRTVCTTVPELASNEANRLFTKERISYFCSDWSVVEKYQHQHTTDADSLLSSITDVESKHISTLSNRSSTHSQQHNSNYKYQPRHCYEVDIKDAEIFKLQQNDLEVGMSRETALNRGGYLIKLNTDRDGRPIEIRAGNTTKRRWYQLRAEGENTILESYKDDKSGGGAPGSKGSLGSLASRNAVSLSNVSSVRTVTNGPNNCFELLAIDNKTNHVFQSDTKEEMLEWLAALSTLLGSPSGSAHHPSYYSLYTANTLQKGATSGHKGSTAVVSSRLARIGEAVSDNMRARKLNRRSLFELHAAVDNERNNVISVRPTELSDANPPAIVTGKLFMATALKLSLNLKIHSAQTQEQHIEPFFTCAALYDARAGKKISEDFYFDLNEGFRDLNTFIVSHTEVGSVLMAPVNIGIDKWPSDARRAIFNVTYPHSDIYFVVRIDKVLQGAINQCVEPYLKGESRKNIIKLADNIKPYFAKLGRYRQKFAWTARPVFLPNGDIDWSGQFKYLIRQEKDNIVEEELIKILKDFKSITKMKLQFIPGVLIVNFSPVPSNEPGILTPGLVPLKPILGKTNSKAYIREIQEFAPHSDYPNSKNTLQPYHEFLHILYIYPLFLTAEIAKAKNISVKVQFFESDDKNIMPLNYLFGRAPGSVFTQTLFTSCAHHYPQPSFNEEFKLWLPVYLHSKHHILFSFYHISCNLQRLPKKANPEQLIGYSWLPVLDMHRHMLVQGVDFCLPISVNLPPGYISQSVSGRGSEIKWYEGRKPIFRVGFRPVSSIYPQSIPLYDLFDMLESTPQKGGFIDESRLVQGLQLFQSIKPNDFFYHLPIILNYLFKMFTLPKNDIFGPHLFSLLIQFTNMASQLELSHHLATFLKYQFTAEPYPTTMDIHTEFVRHMVLYAQQDGVDLVPILKHLFFFLNAISQSMARHLISKKLLQVPRRDRFSKLFVNSIHSLVDSLVSHIMNMLDSKIAISANLQLSCFIRDCFSLLDRGDVFYIIFKYINCLQKSVEPFKSNQFKFDFLRILSDCDQFIPLNLPLKDLNCDEIISLNEQFCKNHYLAGILLQECFLTLKHHPPQERMLAVTTLYHALSNHDSDERYCIDPVKRCRVATLYQPFLSIVMEFASRLISGYETKQLGVTNTIDMFKSPSTHTNPSLSSTASRNRGKKLSFSQKNTHEVPTPSKVESKFPDIPERPASDGSGLLFDSRKDSDVSIPHRKRIVSIASAQSDTQMSFSSGVRDFSLNVSDFTPREAQFILISFLSILKNFDNNQQGKWWDEYLINMEELSSHFLETLRSDSSFLSFFDILAECLYAFSYPGKKSIYEDTLSNTPTAIIDQSRFPKTTTIITNVSDDGDEGEVFLQDEYAASIQKISRDKADLSQEVSLIIMDLLDVFIAKYRSLLEAFNGDNILMQSLFKVIRTFFSLNHSDVTLVHWYGFLFSFVYNFPSVLYKGNSDYCSYLCQESLVHCNSRLQSIRNQACTMVYFLIRNNFEFASQNFVRTQLHITIAISKLSGGKLLGKSDTLIKRSLNAISSYAATETFVKKHVQFQVELQDFLRRLKDILLSLEGLRDIQHDYDKLVELECKLAASYTNNPELKLTWLDSIGSLHCQEGFFAEASQCYLHSSAIVAQYLFNVKIGFLNSDSFMLLSPNIPNDESGMRTDQEIRSEQAFEIKDLVNLLEKCMRMLWEAELYELILEVFKIILPVFEKNRDFEGLERICRRSHEAILKVLDVAKSGKRFLGTYFRVKFIGKGFSQENGKEFIYKEPKVTPLSVFVEKMTNKFKNQCYNELVILSESVSANSQQLLTSDKDYIQITYVLPYFTEEEKKQRLTKFENSHNLSQFYYETPFTKSGHAHGGSDSQYMFVTILRTQHSFPYIKRRIQVVSSERIEMTPIEVAIQALLSKTADLQDILSTSRVDIKHLELELQGCMSTTVNEGPLEYYRAFLSPQNIRKQAVNYVQELKHAYRIFIQVCCQALERTTLLLGDSRLDYQTQLSEAYETMIKTLEPILEPDPSEIDKLRRNVDWSSKNPDHFINETNSRNFHSQLILSAISGSSIRHAT